MPKKVFADVGLWISLALLHGGVGLTALVSGSAKAFLVVLLVSALAFLRYASMAMVATGLGGRSLILVTGVMIWVASLGALGILILAFSRLSAGRFLPWALASALAGPAAATLCAFVKGISVLRTGRIKEVSV